MRGALVLALLAATPWNPVRAQTACAADSRPEVRAMAAAVRYDVAGGTSGLELGPEAAWRLGGVRVGASVAMALLERGDDDPLLARTAIEVPLVTLLGVRVCAAGLAGGSRFVSGDDHASTLAGGLGLGLSARWPLGGLEVAPFGQVRGLAAVASGEALGLPIDARGSAFGGGGGVRLRIGRVSLRAEAMFDGFDGGLGITAYAPRAFRVALGARF